MHFNCKFVERIGFNLKGEENLSFLMVSYEVDLNITGFSALRTSLVFFRNLFQNFWTTNWEFAHGRSISLPLSYRNLFASFE